jgi:hypothetical protein
LKRSSANWAGRYISKTALHQLGEEMDSAGRPGPTDYHSHTSHRRELAPRDRGRTQRSRDSNAPKTWGLVCGAGAKSDRTIKSSTVCRD